MLIVLIFFSIRPYRKEIYRSATWCILGWSNHEHIKFWYSSKIFCGHSSGTMCSLQDFVRLSMDLFSHAFFFQICPLQSPMKWRSVVSFSSPAAKSFTFRVVGGQTLELVIAQFWSSGVGSHETTNVDLEVTQFLFVWRTYSPLPDI